MSRFKHLRRWLGSAARVGGLLAALAVAPVAWGQTPASPAAGWVSWAVPSAHGGVTLRAWWSPVGHAASGAVGGVSASHPAVVLLHGCGGMLNQQGQPSARMREYAQLLNAQGWHTLAVDSLTPRGEKELCTQRTGTRQVTQVQRRTDALAALDWLAAQPGVDAQRLALLGWSHGGSAVLAATNLKHPEVAAAQVRNAQRLRLAVAYYPGCAADAQRGYQPLAPTLLLVGLADDWTPASDCLALATSQVRVLSWAGAYHGFDSQRPVVHRTDVPNGVHPGQGVHVGGHPQARAESHAAFVQALREAFSR